MQTNLVSPDLRQRGSSFLRSSDHFGTPLTFTSNVRRSSPHNLICKAKSDSLLVAITGATGLVGSRLVSRLISEGNQVKVLTRYVDRAKSKLPYPGIEYIASPDWGPAICGCDGVVNLAGEPIATRWSPSIKDEIKRSRVETTKRISVNIIISKN